MEHTAASHPSFPFHRTLKEQEPLYFLSLLSANSSLHPMMLIGIHPSLYYTLQEKMILLTTIMFSILPLEYTSEVR